MRTVTPLFLALATACATTELKTDSDSPTYEITDGEQPEVDNEGANDGLDECVGYEIEVVGSGEMDTGWQCLPVRPYFNLLDAGIIETHPETQNMTWLIEIEASPEADIEMDVVVLDIDFAYGEVDWVEIIKDEPSRWSAETDDGTTLAIGPALTDSDWMALTILEQDAGWNPAVVVEAGSYRRIIVTLDTYGLEFQVGDEATASFDNYQTWESDGVPRISTAHEEFPILGTTYEIVSVD